MKLKDIIQGFLISTTGYYIQKYDQPVDHKDCVQTVKALLRHHKPRCAYDIGANSGFWSSVLKNSYEDLEQVVLFEPQRKYQDALASLDLGNTKKVIYHLGLGSKKQKTSLIGGTTSASVLEIDQDKKSRFTGILNNEHEDINIELLDTIIERDHLPIPDTIKIDVQGYELEVLQGSRQALTKAQFLIVELSFDEFYRNQPKNWEVLKFVEESGYKLIDHGFEWREDYDPEKPLIQIDAIFRNIKT